MRSNIFCYMVLAVILPGTFTSSEAQVKITDGAVLTMNANSLLELESTNKGLLIPRMAINDVNQASPLTAPVPEGMLVYSTGGTVTNGYYYWNGTQWKTFVQAMVQVNGGGTGLTSGTAGGIPAYTGVTTITSSGLLTQNALIVGGGEGATPSTLTIGSADQVLAVNSTSTAYTHRAIKQVLGIWGRDNLQKNQTNLQLLIVSSGGPSHSVSGSRIMMPFNGKIVGIIITGSSPCITGRATFTVFNNATATAVTAVISAENPQYVTTNTGSASFVAGNIIDLRATTDAAFQPEYSNEYYGWIIIEWTN